MTPVEPTHRATGVHRPVWSPERLRTERRIINKLDYQPNRDTLRGIIGSLIDSNLELHARLAAPSADPELVRAARDFIDADRDLAQFTNENQYVFTEAGLRKTERLRALLILIADELSEEEWREYANFLGIDDGFMR